MGTAAGFVLAHAVNKDPRGHELLAEIDSRISEFTERIGDAYREQQNHLNDLVAEVTDAAGDPAKIAD
jgi:ABC-type Fe3+-hydroxamate transport system substrate-binding protein